MTPDEICARYTFSEFFRLASNEEKTIVFLEVARRANEAQREVVRQAKMVQ